MQLWYDLSHAYHKTEKQKPMRVKKGGIYVNLPIGVFIA